MKIRLEVRVQRRNILRFLVVDSTYSNSDKNLCNALAAYRAFMGSGLATSFSWKRKIELLKKLEKDVEAQIVFRHLRVLDDDQSNDFTKNLHEKCMVRKSWKKRFLWKVTSQISDGDKIYCAKKLNASIMLPCERVFLNKIVCCRNLGCNRLKLHLLMIHHSILGENWSTKALLWFKGDLSPSSLDIVKNIVSTVCYWCCFLIASFCCIFGTVFA